MTTGNSKQTKIKKPTASNNGFHSRFDGISNKILKYRDSQQKAKDEAQKSADQKMKELEKAQKNQPVSITQQWADNLGKFTGIKSQNNPAALPTAKPMTPVNTATMGQNAPSPLGSQQKVAFIRSIENSLKVIEKYAAKDKLLTKSIENVSSLNPSEQNVILQNEARKGFKDNEAWINKQLNFWGPMALKMFGLERRDGDKYFKGRVSNINADPTENIGKTRFYDTELFQSRRPL